MKNNTHLGHVLISANKDREPILQYGEGEIHLDKSTGKRGYYLGFYVKYANHSSDLLQEKSGVLKTLPKSVTNNENIWNYYLLNSTLNSTNISSTYSKKELAVTRIWQRTTGITSPKSACGPTTGAMIVNYYKSLGYNVRGSSYYGGHAGLVNHLYTEMNSGMLGTSLSNFASGLFDHLEHDDSTTTWTGLSYDHPNSAINYDTFKSYIDSNRPSAIRYDFFVSNDSYTNYHFVAAVGYEVIPSGSKYFGIKDPDNGQTNTSTVWLNWAAQAPNFSIHLTWSY